MFNDNILVLFACNTLKKNKNIDVDRPTTFCCCDRQTNSRQSIANPPPPLPDFDNVVFDLVLGLARKVIAQL